MKVIGSAADFYRVRVVSIDTTEDLNLEWRDDVLYRRPLSEQPDEERAFIVEAVALDDEERTVPIATFEDASEAAAWAEERQSELADLTKSDFEERYFAGDGLA
ncbi:MAG: hypothetical protein JXP37_10355 [Coriobacteriia bacterium]|nr:hypothetical protein [Coriobacteriia bacterium]